MDAKIIGQAIKELSPEAEFSFKENDLTTLEWHNSKVNRPTNEEILDQCKKVMEKIELEKQNLVTKKQAILNGLGLTADELATLLS